MIANLKGTVGKDQGGLWLPLHTTRGLDPSQRGSKTQAIIQDRKGMRDWISGLLRISRACPRNTQKGSPPATHCHIDRIHRHNPWRIDAVRNGPHFQRSGGHAVTQRRTLMSVRDADLLGSQSVVGSFRKISTGPPKILRSSFVGGSFRQKLPKTEQRIISALKSCEPEPKPRNETSYYFAPN